MKKLIVSLLLLTSLTSTVAQADDWVTALIVGGAAGWALAQPPRQTVYVQPAPYAMPYNGYYEQAPRPIYQYRWVYFPECGCQRQILMQVN